MSTFKNGNSVCSDDILITFISIEYDYGFGTSRSSVGPLAFLFGVSFYKWIGFHELRSNIPSKSLLIRRFSIRSGSHLYIRFPVAYFPISVRIEKGEALDHFASFRLISQLDFRWNRIQNNGTGYKYVKSQCPI